MIQLGLGMKSLQGIAKGGFILGVVVSSGIELMDFMFNNEKTMYDLVGGIGVEAVKGGLGGLVAYAAAAGVAGATTVAVLPLVVMALVAVSGGVVLNMADNHYGIKQKVIGTLKMLPEKIEQGVYTIDTQSQAWQDDLQNAIQRKTRDVTHSIGSGAKDWLCRVSRMCY